MELGAGAGTFHVKQTAKASGPAGDVSRETSRTALRGARSW
jgi:hypothetical protein